MNFGPQQRQIDPNLKGQLRNILNKSEPIRISAAMGDGEAIIFAEEIFSFLSEEGYKMESGISQSVWMPALRGQLVSPGLVDGYRLISVGHQ